MDDLSAPEGAASTALASPDRVATLSARLSEALTAVGIAVRRREAEIELIDRTLAASSDAQSAAARSAAERMARVRSEHADELSLMQRARRALEDAANDAGELSYELDTHVKEAQEAVQENEELRKVIAALRDEVEAERSEAAAEGAKLSALSDDLEQTRKTLAARETELEEVWKELEIKSREAEELGRLMGGFTAGDDALANEPPAPRADDDSAVAAKAPSSSPEANGVSALEETPPEASEEGANGSSADGEVEVGAARQSDGTAAASADSEAADSEAADSEAADSEAADSEAADREAADSEVPVRAAADGDVVESAQADSEAADNDVAASAGANDVVESEAAEEPPAPPSEVSASANDDEGAPFLPRFEEAPDIEIPVAIVQDVIDEMAGVDTMTAHAEVSDDNAGSNGASAESGFTDEVEVEISGMFSEEALEPVTTGVHSRPEEAALDISVDDWGAVVDDNPPEVAASSAAEQAGDVAAEGESLDVVEGVSEQDAAARRERSGVDDALQSYLSSMGVDIPDGPGLRLSADTLFKATSAIAEFSCATPVDVRLAGALQLQSWRPSELAQLLGLEIDLVREKLESYHERGLVEVVSA